MCVYIYTYDGPDLPCFSEDAIEHVVRDAAPSAEPQDVSVVLGQIVVADVLRKKRLAGA